MEGMAERSCGWMTTVPAAGRINTSRAAAVSTVVCFDFNFDFDFDFGRGRGWSLVTLTTLAWLSSWGRSVRGLIDSAFCVDRGAFL